MVDKAARGGETVLKHLKTYVLLLKQAVFVKFTMFYTVLRGVSLSKQQGKWGFFSG